MRNHTKIITIMMVRVKLSILLLTFMSCTWGKELSLLETLESIVLSSNFSLNGVEKILNIEFESESYINPITGREGDTVFYRWKGADASALYEQITIKWSVKENCVDYLELNLNRSSYVSWEKILLSELGVGGQVGVDGGGRFTTLTAVLNERELVFIKASGSDYIHKVIIK